MLIYKRGRTNPSCERMHIIRPVDCIVHIIPTLPMSRMRILLYVFHPPSSFHTADGGLSVGLSSPHTYIECSHTVSHTVLYSVLYTVLYTVLYSVHCTVYSAVKTCPV